MRGYRSVMVHAMVVLILAAIASPMYVAGLEAPSSTWEVWMVAAYSHLVLAAIGAPWSLPPIALDGLGMSNAVIHASGVPLVMGGAVLNVVIHYFWRRAVTRSQRADTNAT